jgi:hypothetical protein
MQANKTRILEEEDLCNEQASAIKSIDEMAK